MGNGIRERLLESGEEQIPGSADGILAFLIDLFFTLIKCLKIIITIGFIIHLWTYTCVNRTKQFGIVHELSRQGLIKITYHHDRVSSDSSFEHRNNGESDQHEDEIAPPAKIEAALKEDAGDYKKDLITDEEYKQTHPDWVDHDGNSLLHLSEDVL